MSFILFAVFVLLIVITVPIAFAPGIAAALWVAVSGLVPMIMLPQRMYAGIDSFPLIAIPFFILAGKIMAAGGISDRLIKVSSVLVGRFKGGLAYINIVSSMFFAGITGSATADSSSIGSILIPAMIIFIPVLAPIAMQLRMLFNRGSKYAGYHPGLYALLPRNAGGPSAGNICPALSLWLPSIVK